jgi:diguanylate cyclase (GGDEF)-like protein
MAARLLSRGRVLLLGAAAYAVVFAALCVLHVAPIAVAVYFVIPTALVAIAGGPVAGVGGVVATALLFLVAKQVNPSVADSMEPSSSVASRLVALVFTGVLVGWFADRNRALVAELRLRAERDYLTGLGNHRFFDASIERRLGAGGSFALLLCDMDRLKDVNDGQGHSAGDEALRNLADVLRSAARADDDLARIGGDEFCLVAAVRTSSEADAIAGRVEDALDAAGCSATVGWATHPADARTKADLFRIADERLYVRKAARATTLRSLSATG